MPKFDIDDYIPVQERINRFWSEYPDGRIVTQMCSLPDDFERVVFRADVYKSRDHPAPDATGWDAEVAGTGGANNGAHHANCETSAIGRALANMGYATSQQDRPSREEMGKVERGGDAAVARPAGQGAARPHAETSGATRTTNSAPRPLRPATDQQMNYIKALGKDRGAKGQDGHTDVPLLADLLSAEFGIRWDGVEPMGHDDARRVLDAWAPIRDWTAFWNKIKPYGYTDKSDLQRRTGIDITHLEPQAALEAVTEYEKGKATA